MPRHRASTSPEHLYHVTYSGRLSSIAASGLRPGQARSIGAPCHDAHAAKGVFLTAPAGAFFWHGRAEAFAEHNSDDVVADELIPVVLRVATSDSDDAERDDPGSRDALAEAVIVKNAIAPDRLEVFDGSDWVDVADYDSIDFEQAVDTESSDDEFDDEGQPVQWHYFKSRSPLFPEELHP